VGKDFPRGLAATGLVAFALAALPLPAEERALAQVPSESGLQTEESEQPMLLQADEMIYDNQNNKVTAQSNVEIYYGSYTLTADKVTYDRGGNTLIAEGNVIINEPDGAVINADRITLTDDFRDAFIDSLRIVTLDDSRFVAARATRQAGETTVFEHAAYTACKVSPANLEAPPTWQIKASRIIHKKTEATIEYENPRLEMFGYPVAWAPWFKHADHTVNRKSGFLIPSFGTSDELGVTVETPYFFALAPNYDFTFSPVYTEKQGILWKGKWRHRTANGRYSIELAGIDQKDPKAGFSTSEDDFRGSIKTEGKFALNQYWKWGWDITAETDDTFRRFYNLDNILTTDRVSEVYLEGQRDRNYFSAQAFSFGGLLLTDRDISESKVHPVIDYNYIYGEPVLGGELSFDTNVLSFSGDDGTKSNRLITQMKWRRSFIDRRGQVLTPFFMARGDYYSVSDFEDPITGRVEEDDNIVRGMGNAGMEYRYPFVHHTSGGAHVVEPVGQIVARPRIGDQREIPRTDSLSLVFDDTLLFDTEKFSGYDRVQSGTRANVGVRYTFQRYRGGYMRAVFGQSYHLGGDNVFEEEFKDSGLDTTSSDYVGGLYIQPMGNFSFIAQSRFDEETLNVNRTDLATKTNVGPFGGSLVYANIEAQPASGIDKDREEIQGRGSTAIAKHWSLFGRIRYDIEGDQRIKNSLGLKYHDCCFALSLAYDERFIRDRDIEPDQRVMLRFEFKHLGAFDVDTSVTDAGF
jgi:LPS-assembly protein